ncbi:hypothetical protein [Oceanibacterium hippocampi]|uniref:Chromosome partition protein Smc n=1 Tax=Oceanibacterium hippocampi TaxID=745714 RepID=A0A1Y5U3T3_9PROT|nr:hypothetical protein [Oceanibacterium hippocampi]SLN77711.1 hypothetical protein OCH7691_04516 [Oceanibacterium hippocampi]
MKPAVSSAAALGLALAFGAAALPDAPARAADANALAAVRAHDGILVAQADPRVTLALRDLKSLAEKVKALKPGDKSTGQAYMGQLGRIGQKLKAAKVKTGPEYAEAVTLYNALNQDIVAIANAPAGGAKPATQADNLPASGGSAPATTAPSQTTTAPSTAEPATSAAAAEMSSLEKTRLSRVKRKTDGLRSRLESYKSVDLQNPANAEKTRGDIQIVRDELAALGRDDHPDVVAEAARLDELETFLDSRVEAAAADLTPEEKQKVEATADKVYKALKGTETENIGLLQPPERQETYRGYLATLRGELDGLPKQDHPAVLEIRANLDKADRTLAARIAQADQLTEKYGLILARYVAIQEKYKSDNFPARLADPLEKEQVRAWGESVTQWYAEQEKDSAWLQSIQPLGIIDKQKMSSALFWIGSNTRRTLDEMMNEATQLVNGKVGIAMDRATFVETTDASDPHQVANRLLGEGKFEETVNGLNEGLEYVAIAAAFDEATGGSDHDRVAEKARVEAALVRLDELTEIALTEMRVPKVRSTDGELRAAAEEALKREVEGGIEWARMEITYDLNRREKLNTSFSRSSISTVTGTTYHYLWDEFGVTTVEKVGDKYFMHYNKLAFYHKGDDRTRLNKWILVDRFRTSQILEENIDK